MLKQTIDGTDIDNPLVTNGGWVEMGAYPEFVFMGDDKKNIEVELDFDAQKSEGKYAYHYPNKAPRKINLKIIFSYNKNTTQIELVEREIYIEDSAATEKIVYDKHLDKYNLHYSSDLDKDEFDVEVKPIKFHGYRPVFNLDDRDSYMRIRRALASNSGYFIERIFKNLYYLGPIRDYPKRLYGTSGQYPQDVGIHGERALDVLRLCSDSQHRDIRNVEIQAKKWLKLFNIADNIELEQIVQGLYYMIYVIDSATKMRVNLADIGFGASQTLPIIIQSFYSARGSVLLIEQPEIHLHPRAQSILGDLFIDAILNSRRTLVVETHSEHILARVRRRIAEKKLTKEDIAIYYFNPTTKGTDIMEVTINDNGQYENFPEGFFEEDLVEAFEHLKAINRKS